MNNQDVSNSIPCSIDDYIVHAVIGQGGQARVYLCTKPGLRILLSVKVYEGDECQKDYERQVNILLKLDHQNVIKLQSYNPHSRLKYSHTTFEKLCPIIVSEFAYYGELYSLAQIKDGLSEKTSRYLFIKILKTLEYFNSVGIAHRDIKLQNILLDQYLNIKIIDFGLSTTFQLNGQDQYSTDHVGTQYYKAPQLYNSQYSFIKADIFAAGVLFFCMLLNRLPFKSAKNSNKQYGFLRTGNQKDFWKFHIQKFKKKSPLFQNQQFKTLMSKFFNHDPKLRPNFEELNNNQWLNNNLATQEQVKKQIIENFQQIIKTNQQIASLYKIVHDLLQQFKKQDDKNQMVTMTNFSLVLNSQDGSSTQYEIE